MKSNITNIIHKAFHTRSLQLAAVLGLLVSALAPAGWSKEQKPKAEAIKIVASLSFDNKQATDMRLREAGGKTYLYVSFAGQDGFAVVDATQPARLKIISSLSSVDSQGASHLDINGNLATVAAGQPANAAGEVALWDISIPGNPRLVQQFSHVLRIVTDQRNYIYVLNQNGLTVVSDTSAPPANTNDAWNPSVTG